VSSLKTLKWVSYACLLLGFLLPLITSHYVGMSLYQRPAITTLHVLLWAIGLIFCYCAHLREKNIPSAAPAWKKICGFVTANPATIVFLGLLWGYIYFPTMEKSPIALRVNICMVISLFLCGMQITKDDWKNIVRQPRIVAWTVVVRWIVPPLVAFLLAQILSRNLPRPIGGMLAIGMVLISTTPTGVASNAMTLVSRGDLALSVSITAVNNVIAPFLQPVLVAVLAGTFLGKLDTWPLFVELLEIVLVPVIFGSIVGAVFAKQVKGIRPLLGAIAVLCVSILMLANVARSMGTLLKQLWIIPWMLAATTSLALAGLLAGYYLMKFFGLNQKQRVAACFGVSVENGNLATVLALNHFGPLAALPSIFYGKLQQLLGIGIFVRKFQRIPELADEEPTAAMAAAGSK
jgi:BASS family bile acid:Na+ symporter